MKPDRFRLFSALMALLAFVALTLVALAMNSVIAQKARLESRNDMERTLSVLLAGLRDHRDFGAAIESVPSLKGRVIGVGAYAEDGAALYVWGDAPVAYPVPGATRRVAGEAFSAPPGEADRLYFDVSANDSVALVLSPFRVGPPPPAVRDTVRDGASVREPDASTSFFFSTLRRAETVYLEVRQSGYWHSRRAAVVVLPLVELALLALVWFVRGLIVRNAGYRRRIEEQRSLVVLGTAASTLAHEIKNPLLSIRLQTRILEKTCPESARRELSIIDDEVERLSLLSQRVGDYLRDPAGKPVPLDARALARELGQRLVGRDLLIADGEAAVMVRIDPERFRSVLENLVQNALESGSPTVEINLRRNDSDVVIDVSDRGSGLDPEAARRVFDPFYTTNSRGTGIGLAICKRFVEAAGGSISLEARPGGGCVARLVLPACEGDT